MRWLRPVSIAAAAVVVVALGPVSALAAAGGSVTRHGATASLPVLTVTMNGKKITVTGPGTPLDSGAYEVVSKVSHEPMGSPTFVRLDPGVSVQQLFAAAAGDPNNVALIASIMFSPQANKGTSQAQVALKPGNYVAVDLATSAAIPPYTVFTVGTTSDGASLPKPKASMNTIEFGFRGPGKLHDGELVRFGNHGYLVHMMFAARAASKAKAELLAKYLKEGKDGKAMRLADASYQFFGILTHDQSFQQVVNVRPGYWVLACFMDTQDHREHTTLGMERVIQIVK